MRGGATANVEFKCHQSEKIRKGIVKLFQLPGILSSWKQERRNGSSQNGGNTQTSDRDDDEQMFEYSPDFINFPVRLGQNVFSTSGTGVSCDSGYSRNGTNLRYLKLTSE